MNSRKPQDNKSERKTKPQTGRPVRSKRAEKPAENKPRVRTSSGKEDGPRFAKTDRPAKSSPSGRPADNRPRTRTDSAQSSDDTPRFTKTGRPAKNSRTGKPTDNKKRTRTTYGKPSEDAPRFTKTGASYKKSGSKGSKSFSGERNPTQSDTIRLNKYLADAGVCSRREADELIKAGVVKVNGEIVTEMGTKVSIHDKVIYGGQTLSREKLRYVLLNKPKDFITTSDDPFNRKTVMELVSKACSERIYPVGRLDRNTLGLLLFTNDGELAKRLMHPRHKVKKLYHVELDKALTKGDMLKIVEGIELEDGSAEVDKIAYVQDADSKKEVGLELHSGKNRIVRRIFESLGYKVVRLDRVMYAGLTKLNLTRGHWRHLTPREVAMLKMIK